MLQSRHGLNNNNKCCTTTPLHLIPPIRKEDIQVIHAEPLTQPLSSCTPRVSPREQPTSSHPDYSLYYVQTGFNDGSEIDEVKRYIDTEISQHVVAQIDQAAKNMDRVPEGASIDTTTFQHRLKALEKKVTGVLFDGVVVGALAGLIWLWNRFKGEEKRRRKKGKNEREREVYT